MAMGMTTVWLKIDEGNVVQALQEAGERLDGFEGEVALDFFSVHRIDTNSVRALEWFAHLADDQGIKVVLRGVNIGVYKVLKLVKLGSRFSFTS
ncbi:MAG: STAS domain-containing protein [Terriglobales bacterium]